MTTSKHDMRHGRQGGRVVDWKPPACSEKVGRRPPGTTSTVQCGKCLRVWPVTNGLVLPPEHETPLSPRGR